MVIALQFVSEVIVMAAASTLAAEENRNTTASTAIEVQAARSNPDWMEWYASLAMLETAADELALSHKGLQTSDELTSNLPGNRFDQRTLTRFIKPPTTPELLFSTLEPAP